MSNTVSGLGIGGFTGLGLFLADAVITGNTNVPIETAVAVAIFICGLVWWMGRKFQALEDSVKNLSDRLGDLYCVRTKEGKCVERNN